MSQPSLELLPDLPRILHFDAFALDVRSGELRKNGIRVRIGKQTFQILLMLLKKPGEVVLRDEIRHRLWPNNTVVEFDHSINAAIQKLRDALGESADNPRYVETLKGRGYRFLGTVEAVPVEPAREAPLKPKPLMAVQETPRVRPSLFRSARARIVTACCIIMLVAAAVWLLSGRGPARVQNWVFPLGEVEYSVISSDGSAVVSRLGRRSLLIRRMDNLADIPIEGIQPPIDVPEWSPDGSQIVFSTLDGLIKMQPPNGLPTTICKLAGPTRGVSWGADGTILIAIIKLGIGELDLVSSGGGEPVRLEVPGLTHGRFYRPEFLPNGEDFIFAWTREGDEEAGLYLAGTRHGKLTREPVLLRKNMTAGHYSTENGGSLLFVEGNNLYTQKLNTRSGKLEGDPERVVDGIFTDPGARRASFSVSRNGVLVWRKGTAAMAQPVWFDRGGKVLKTAAPPAAISDLNLSADEKRLLITELNGRTTVVDADHLGVTSLPSAHGARWMPDSNHILYYDRPSDTMTRLFVRLAGGGPATQLAQIPAFGMIRDISADGRVLLYRSAQWSLYSTRIDGLPNSTNPQPLFETKERVMCARFSPDGKWIVYSSGEQERSQVYVRRLAPGGLRRQISLERGRIPVWRADGKEILYTDNSRIWSVRIQIDGEELQASAPEPLFEIRHPVGLVGSSEPLAVTRDGSRILFAQEVGQPDGRTVYVMTAWPTALKH